MRWTVIVTGGRNLDGPGPPAGRARDGTAPRSEAPSGRVARPSGEARTEVESTHAARSPARAVRLPANTTACRRSHCSAATAAPQRLASSESSTRSGEAAESASAGTRPAGFWPRGDQESAYAPPPASPGAPNEPASSADSLAPPTRSAWYSRTKSPPGPRASTGARVWEIGKNMGIAAPRCALARAGGPPSRIPRPRPAPPDNRRGRLSQPASVHSAFAPPSPGRIPSVEVNFAHADPRRAGLTPTRTDAHTLASSLPMRAHLFGIHYPTIDRTASIHSEIFRLTRFESLNRPN